MSNTLINKQAFGETVEEYLKTSGALNVLRNEQPHEFRGGGESIVVTIANELDEATEVDADGNVVISDIKDTKKTLTFKQYQKAIKVTDMELQSTTVDSKMDIKAKRTAQSIKEKYDIETIKALKESAVDYEVDEINDIAILEAQGKLGVTYADEDTYILGTGTAIANLKKGIKKGDLTQSNSALYDSKFLTYKNTESEYLKDDEVYLVIANSVTTYISKPTETHVFQELGKFYGEMVRTDTIFTCGVLEKNRVIRIVKKTV